MVILSTCTDMRLSWNLGMLAIPGCWYKWPGRRAVVPWQHFHSSEWAAILDLPCIPRRSAAIRSSAGSAQVDSAWLVHPLWRRYPEPSHLLCLSLTSGLPTGLISLFSHSASAWRSGQNGLQPGLDVPPACDCLHMRCRHNHCCRSEERCSLGFLVQKWMPKKCRHHWMSCSHWTQRALIQPRHLVSPQPAGHERLRILSFIRPGRCISLLLNTHHTYGFHIEETFELHANSFPLTEVQALVKHFFSWKYWVYNLSFLNGRMPYALDNKLQLTFFDHVSEARQTENLESSKTFSSCTDILIQCKRAKIFYELTFATRNTRYALRGDARSMRRARYKNFCTSWVYIGKLSITNRRHFSSRGLSFAESAFSLLDCEGSMYLQGWMKLNQVSSICKEFIKWLASLS